MNNCDSFDNCVKNFERETSSYENSEGYTEKLEAVKNMGEILTHMQEFRSTLSGDERDQKKRNI